jgi:predicted SAM-dependent methyltransferase
VVTIESFDSALKKYPAIHSTARFMYFGAHRSLARAVRPYQISKYLRSSRDFAGLQIGAGPHQLSGWLKTDLAPTNLMTAYLDAAKRFPVADETFDCVVAEHIIEHISYDEALRMLRECHRVLKKGGVVRISTPDIELTHRLMHRPLAPELQHYVSWSNGAFGHPDDIDSAIHVVNRLQHEWGHQFLYDADTLTGAFRRAGFADTTRCKPGMSDHSALVNVDSHSTQIGTENNELESLIIEGIK